MALARGAEELSQLEEKLNINTERYRVMPKGSKVVSLVYLHDELEGSR